MANAYDRRASRDLRKGLARLAAGGAVALCLGAAAPSLIPVRAHAETVDWEAAVGVPRGSATKQSPWVFTLTLPPAVAGGKPTFEKITIDDLPAIMAGETLSQASARKAKTVADAINAKLGAGRATIAVKKVDVITGWTPVRDRFGRIIRFDPVTTQMEQSFLTVTGLFTEPAQRGRAAIPAFKQKTNPTREFGDGGRLMPGLPPPSPGYSGSMGGLGFDATGMDGQGNPSFVDFGLDGIYVAGVEPTAGEPDYLVLDFLAHELRGHGVPAAFEFGADTLSLRGVPSSEQIDFANTDTGLDFRVAFSASAIPEPATWASLILGGGLAGAALRRRRRATPIDAVS
ncbi:MAG TPA: PEPxxWA-CTERM sorting domain-containing protein [Caulobacteraceae bacterium]|nr:PEPxxWA-CTERM sorting domain-containing protein [Caulobacteraceae bacterium]